MMADEESDGDLYCLCRRPYQEDAEFMIECDVCKDWFHGSCVGIEEHQSIDIDKYHCPNCQPEHGPLTLKRRRNWHRHDYSEINDGKKAIQSGTVIFVKNLKRKRFQNADGEVLFHMKGSEVTLDYFEQNGFVNPLIVDKKDGLGLKVPPSNFTIADVERCVGSMRDLDVIDVSRQDDLRMKMREWTDYYEDVKGRKKILNVISLEFTGTELAKVVCPPLVVRKIDWINNHWPDTLPEDSSLSRPMVQKYCLMGVKDSYTDFHVDFGGTSVWYHILWGEKVFYLIPPTEENLLKYEDWVSSPSQSETFFGDMVSKCYVTTISQGNTLFIPTGWIHAVLTPQDSLVFGGNFLHRFGMSMQLRIYELELRLNTPLKFRHPYYEALTWYAAKNYLLEMTEYLENGADIPGYLVEGLKEVIYSFTDWTKNREKLKLHASHIPPDIRAPRLIEQLSKVMASARLKAEEAGLDADEDKRRRRMSPRLASRRKRTSSWGDEEGEGQRRGQRRRRSGSGKRKSIKMKLATSERKVIKKSGNPGEQVSLKLSVPEAKVLSLEGDDGEEDEVMGGEEGEEEDGSTMSSSRTNSSSSSSDGSLYINDDDTTPPPTDRKTLRPRGRRYKEDHQGYKDGDFLYPTLDVEEEEGSGSKGAGPARKTSESEEDSLWRPQGPVQLVKGSIASSFRENRNAKKRSFEQSMSATAAKILKMEQEMGVAGVEEARPGTKAPPSTVTAEVPRNRQADPILGGGALKVEVCGDNGRVSVEGEEKGSKSRAAAAANAVDAMLAASRPKSKLLTPKQRLGKILGLNKPKRKT